MKYDDMPKIVCEAEEEEWLNVNFSANETEWDEPDTDVTFVMSEETPLQPHFVKKERRNRKKGTFLQFRGIGAFFKKHYKKALTAVAVVGVLVGMMFVDSGFSSNVFDYVKETYTSTLQDVKRANATLKLPASACVQNVENGQITFTGGKLVLNLLQGTVEKIEGNKITVQSGDVQIVYDRVTDVLAQESQQVSQFDVLGKYTDSTTVCILYNGEAVTDVVQNNFEIQWKV